jgi:aryl-alcohol dehydrogenase-like predicted oxidoreductase
VRSPDGSRLPCGRPEHLRSACEASLRRLGLEAIDLYQLHRPDPDVPYDESLGALAELAERGIVRAIGVSNVSADLVGLAHDVCGDALVAVQNALPPWSEPPDDVGNVCARLGLVLLAYGVLGGTGRAAGLATEHPTAQAMAAARGVSVQRLAVAWTLAVVPPALPIVGARRPSSIRDSAAAVKLSLARQELRALALR